MRRLLNEVIFALALSSLFVSSATGQVRTVTLGITTHCPYGVGGCWAEIKNGLPMTEIAAIPQRPDTKTQTFDVHMRDGWVPDPSLFARNFRAMNVGVDVRGVEAMIDGVVHADGTNLVLRVNGTSTVMTLAPLTRTVHWDIQRNRPAKLTRAEVNAFEKLAAQARKESRPVRVTGPLVPSAASLAEKPRQILEVRKFEVLKTTASINE